MDDPDFSNLSRSVQGHVVLITGAASGIGRATAKLFAREGAKVAVTDRGEEGVQKVVEEITSQKGTAKGWELDVTSSEQIEKVINEVALWGEENSPRIDVLVNNAGLSASTSIDDPNYVAAWNTSIAVMLTAQTTTIRAALPHLRKAENPRIINISSTEGVGGSPTSSAYTAAKHGVVGLTRALAVELGDEGE